MTSPIAEDKGTRENEDPRDNSFVVNTENFTPLNTFTECSYMIDPAERANLQRAAARNPETMIESGIAKAEDWALKRYNSPDTPLSFGDVKITYRPAVKRDGNDVPVLDRYNNVRPLCDPQGNQLYDVFLDVKGNNGPVLVGQLSFKEAYKSKESEIAVSDKIFENIKNVIERAEDTPEKRAADELNVINNGLGVAINEIRRTPGYESANIQYIPAVRCDRDGNPIINRDGTERPLYDPHGNRLFDVYVFNGPSGKPVKVCTISARKNVRNNQVLKGASEITNEIVRNFRR